MHSGVRCGVPEDLKDPDKEWNAGRGELGMKIPRVQDKV